MRSSCRGRELVRSSTANGDRNSDPPIGAQINALARARADVMLADPAGLYLNDFTPAGFTTPDGTNAKTFWRFTRQRGGRRLRGVFEVPASK